MDNILDTNTSKSDEKTEWPRRTDKVKR